MKYIIFDFLVAFSAVFIFSLIFVVFNKKKRNKIFLTMGALFIKSKFKVDFENENKKRFAVIMSLADAFICGVTYAILCLFKNIYLGFLVSAIVLIILIMIVYSIIGSFYKKKEGKKNV